LGRLPLSSSCEGRSSPTCSCSLLMSPWIACYLPISLSTTQALKIGYEELVLGLGKRRKACTTSVGADNVCTHCVVGTLEALSLRSQFHLVSLVKTGSAPSWTDGGWRRSHRCGIIMHDIFI
jgi:hypothetical protein